MTDRKAHWITFCIFGVVITAVVAGIIVLGNALEKRSDANASGQPARSFVLRTVEHDGHSWVVVRQGMLTHFVHHPDCCKELSDD